ncbi:hypothetical protein LIER_43971 [Lithospermum erythrorhizon]|uniref:Gag-pol polyprotein n=1 Tax=Lithospermum erythrorhizon TaxID=34254 RepID=A0AAV3RJ44_LITER
MGSIGNLDFKGTFCGEGISSSRSPLLDGTNYDYWSNRMRFHVQSIDYVLWRIIIDGPLIPMKIKTTQAGSASEDASEEDNKKAQEAVASSIEVPITNVDKTNLSELRPDELKKIALNAKAVNLLHNAMCMEVYGRIKSCKTAKEIWDLLETAHVGTNQVKQTKIRLLTKEYQMFEMKEGESIADMHQRLNVILNNLE